MNIADQADKIGITLTKLRLEASLEQMPYPLIPDVEVLGIAGQQALHDRRSGALIHLDQQMKMVRHQTIGVQLEGMTRLEEPELFQKTPALTIIQEDILLIVASANDVEDRAWEMDSWFSRHSLTIYTTTPPNLFPAPSKSGKSGGSDPGYFRGVSSF